MNREYYLEQIRQLLDLEQYGLARQVMMIMKTDKDIIEADMIQANEYANKFMDEVSQ